MIKKIFFLIFLISLFLSGCINTDYTEPENRTIVTALIIENSGEYTVTAEITNILENSGEKKFESEFITGSGKELSATFEALQSNFSKELSLYHCPLIICEKKLFSSEFKELSSYILENSQISLAADFVVVDSVNDLIKAAQESEVFIGNKISEQIQFKEWETKIIDILRNKRFPLTLNVNNKEILVESYE